MRQRKKRLERLFLKVDFAKSYDPIDWRFLDLMMESFGFDSLCKKWVIARPQRPQFSLMEVHLVNSPLNGV